MQCNIQYLEDKALYWKSVRQLQNIFRTDLQIQYQFNERTIVDNHAIVNVSAFISFCYTDTKRPAFKEDIFIVDLVNFEGQWVVTDVLEAMDWFDATYKNDPSFEVERVLQTYESAVAADQLANANAEPYSSSSITRSSSLTYNKNNAAAYAYTYTTSVKSNTPTDFYNANFQSFSNDCMNFVSQCIWAGFGGNNTVSAINSYAAPMDAAGYYWFNSQNENYHSGSWSSCSQFRTYVENSNNNTSETGLRATKYSIASGASFSSIPGYMDVLFGSVLHVPGDSSDYGHAIVVTDVYGYERSQVEYCAHTGMAKGLKIGDKWSEGKIYVYEPTSFYSSSTLSSPRITVTMHRPVRQNTTVTLTAAVDTTCYKITTTVISPAGNQETTEVTNANSMTTNVTLSEYAPSQDLYIVKVTAMKTATSTPVEYYYTIRTWSV